jgi:hypothetical protein
VVDILKNQHLERRSRLQLYKKRAFEASSASLVAMLTGDLARMHGSLKSRLSLEIFRLRKSIRNYFDSFGRSCFHSDIHGLSSPSKLEIYCLARNNTNI